MSIMNLNNISQAFGGFDVFVGVTGRVEADSKIGLVGPNGIGKTTLLRIIAGLATPTTGSVTLQNGVRMGYLRQEAMQAFSEATNTLHEELLSLFAGVQAMEDRMRDLEEQMGAVDGDQLDAVLDEYGQLQTEFERIGGYDYELRIDQTLTGLGFKPEHYGLPLMHLSGGQKTRALLAKLLLERPDLLIMDEPTNHLDVAAIQWLERALATWKGALLIVSHDRYFLDRVVNTVWEMARTGMDSYRGNYSAYLKQREAKREHEMKMYEQELERLANEMEYIKKNIARASTNGMAVGRLRRLSRDLVAIEELGLISYKQAKSWSDTGIGGVRPFTVMEAEKSIKGIPAPFARPPKLAMRFESARRSGEKVLAVRDLLVGYPGNPLFETDEIGLFRGEIAALIGPNGTGKTTFLKMLMGEVEALQGHMHLGMNVKVGYFAQAHDSLNLEKTVIDTLIDRAHELDKRMGLGEARKYLAMYLFRSDDVFKKVEMLSGGERGRLALAMLSLEGANFLLLDEPTNHLDIPAQEVLQEVLEAFPGTILLVSHDRYLIDRLATQIWNLEAGEKGEPGWLRVFSGTYEEYLAALEAEKAELKDARAAAKKARRAVSQNGNGKRKSGDVEKLEAQIHALEGTMYELDKLLERASAAGRAGDVARLGEEYTRTSAQLESLMAQWSEVAEA
jgi:ATP-binding cassette subfamily F protein 3